MPLSLVHNPATGALRMGAALLQPTGLRAMLNFTQYATAIRALLLFASGILVSRGWLSEAQASYLTDASNISIVLGGIGALATFVWSIWARRPSALVKATAALPEVQTVVTDHNLAVKVDSNKVTSTKIGL